MYERSWMLHYHSKHQNSQVFTRAASIFFLCHKDKNCRWCKAGQPFAIHISTNIIFSPYQQQWKELETYVVSWLQRFQSYHQFMQMRFLCCLPHFAAPYSCYGRSSSFGKWIAEHMAPIMFNRRECSLYICSIWKLKRLGACDMTVWHRGIILESFSENACEWWEIFVWVVFATNENNAFPKESFSCYMDRTNTLLLIDYICIHSK